MHPEERQFELWKVVQDGHVHAVECVLGFLVETAPPLITPGVTMPREYPAVVKAEALRGAAIANVAARMEAENFMVPLNKKGRGDVLID